LGLAEAVSGNEKLARKVADATGRAKIEREWIKAETFFRNMNEMQRRFVSAGARFKYRHNESCNRSGKTSGNSCETSFHLDGDYPDGWDGRVFTEPVQWVVIAESTRAQRDSVQLQLLGQENDWGTGFVGKPKIAGKPVMRAGCPGVVDYFFVHHKSGGISKCTFQSADQAPGTLAGGAWHGVQYDENVSLEHWTEASMRTASTGGIVYGAYTPLITTPLVVHLKELAQKAPNLIYREADMNYFENIRHLSDEEKQAFILSIPESEREARLYGRANFRGAGLVYPVDPSVYVIEPVCPGTDWRKIAGMDIGTVDGTAGVWIAEDPMTRILHVYDEYFATTNDVPAVVSSADPSAIVEGFYRMNAINFQQRGYGVPVAWPHDGGKGAAYQRPTISIYRDECGLNMIPEPVTLRQGTLEDGIAKVLNLLQTGRMKIHRNCHKLLKAMQNYQRDTDGSIKRHQPDHLPDALRYGTIMFDQYAERIHASVYDRPAVLHTRFRPWR